MQLATVWVIWAEKSGHLVCNWQLNVTGIVSSGPKMEGQALMRDDKGELHLLGS